MFSHPQQGMERDEVQILRKEGGAWLRDRRVAVRLSQRELSIELGLDYYTFISQIESGRGRVPPSMIEKWAKAVKYPVREFAIHLMKYYDPLNYELIFGGEGWNAESPEQEKPNNISPDLNVLTSMQDRMDRLEKLLAKIKS